jgi:hypothetical protein
MLFSVIVSFVVKLPQTTKLGTFQKFYDRKGLAFNVDVFFFSITASFDNQ